MPKEKLTKKVVFLVQKSLYIDFACTCERQYKTMSEVIRDFMLQFVQKHKEHQNEEEKK